MKSDESKSETESKLRTMNGALLLLVLILGMVLLSRCTTDEAPPGRPASGVRLERQVLPDRSVCIVATNPEAGAALAIACNFFGVEP